MNTLEVLESSIEETSRRLHELRVKHQRASLENQLNRERQSNHVAKLSLRISTILEEEISKRASLQPYITAVRSVMVGEGPQYVQTLQSKVCQSLHFMGMYEDQLRRLKVSCESQTKYLKAESVLLTDETTKCTLELLNKIAFQDDFNHNLRMAYLDVLKAQTAIIRSRDLRTQPIGSINVSISGDEDATVRLDITRRTCSDGDKKVYIKSGELAKYHMERMEGSCSENLNDSDSSLYISPVSVIPKGIVKADESTTNDLFFPTPELSA